MDESKDLLAGMETTYLIGGKTVWLVPVTLGKMKKASQVFQKKNLDSFEMIEEHLVELLSNGKNPFMSKEWVRDNITMPIATKIIEDSRAINGMADFQKGAASSPQKNVRDLVERTPTPSA